MASLRLKLVTPFILGTLVLTTALVWYVNTNARQAVEEATLLIAEAKTNQTVSTINVYLKSMTTSIHNIVADPHVTDLFTTSPPSEDAIKKANEWLTIVTQGNELYRDIYIVDKQGKCIVSSNPGHLGVFFADKEFVHVALGGFFKICDPNVGRVTKNFSATIAGPVDVDNDILGALVIINEFPQLVDYDTKATHGSQTVSTIILTPEGMLMAHPDKQKMGKTFEEYRSLYQTLTSASSESGMLVSYTLDKHQYLGYAKLVPSTKWLVITSGVNHEIFAVADRISGTVQRISFFFLLLVSAVVIVQANSILNSLFSLINFAKKIAEGETTLTLESTTRNDEIGVLHNALRKLVETLQAMIEKLNEASEMKGRFLANMSHEIRTPLNAIIGISHLAQRDKSLPPQHSNYLAKIHHSAKTLLYLINDILDLSKVEADMLSMEHIAFNLREVIENCMSMLQDSANNKGLFMTLEYHDRTPEHFVGDPLRIGQVLNNLVSNAIKFTAEGDIVIKCWEAQPEGPLLATVDTSRQAVMHLSVSDSGIGISEESQKRLFQPFIQADASITRRFGGTGLGLAISDKLVKCMHGAFQVESLLGHGTTFHFYIVLERDLHFFTRMEDTSEETCFTQVCLRGKHILIAEDNEINQFVISEMLSPTGVQITMTANGQEAVEAIKTGTFDLVLMDMQMPVLDGLAATLRIREFISKEELPIIAVTANAMSEDKVKGFACGMNDYLTKPIDPVALLRVLRIWLM